MRITIALAFAAVASATPWNYREPWTDRGECAHSGDQSPIDILTAKVTTGEQAADGAVLERLKWGYGVGEPEPRFEMPAEFETNPHTWEVVIGEGGPEPFVEWQGKEFKLVQFHYHSPSENTVNGLHYDMECHHVHKAADGQVLVLAAFMSVAEADNGYLANFWAQFPEQVGPVSGLKQPIGEIVSPYENFLPADKSYYYYMGSFTTPLCDTNVVWITLKNPVSISLAQRDTYRLGINRIQGNQLTKEGPPAGVAQPWDVSLGNNDRDTQPLGNRVVAYYEDRAEAMKELGLAIMIIVGVVVCGIVGISLYRKKAKVQKKAIKNKKPEEIVRVVEVVQPAYTPMASIAVAPQYTSQFVSQQQPLMMR